MGDQALRLAERPADQPDDLDVLLFVVSADVVHLADPSVPDDPIDRLAVILDIQPVAHIETLTVHRKRLVRQRIDNHQRNQLLRKMVRTVVVGAARDGHRQSVGAVIRHDQQIRRRLGRRIRTARVDRRLLREEQIRPVERQIAVDLVGRDLMIPPDAVLAAGVHQHGGADDVGLQKDLGVFNRAVDMALGGEIHHDIRMLLLEQAVHARSVADIRLDKPELRMRHHRRERAQIARIRQLVQTDHAVLRMVLQQIVYKIASNKSGAAGHNNCHNPLPRTLKIASCPRRRASDARRTATCRRAWQIPPAARG